MRVVHIGMGQFGIGWFKALAARKDMELSGVVDISEEALKNAAECGCKLYTDAALAMDEQKPDFIFNATPPAIHKLINKLAYERGIPILSEKPIAEGYSDAVEILEFSQNGLKLMIAENYRYLAPNRFIKNLLESGQIGDVTDIKIEFRRKHIKTNYHKYLTHPMLLDVGIHHLDMLRYFTGSEANSIYADFHRPEWSWYQGYSNANLLITMENGVKACYNGRLDAHDNETSWYAGWAFTGEKGVLRYDGETAQLYTEGKSTEISLPRDEIPFRDIILNHFKEYLENDILPETHISDNIKTFNIAECALKSFELKKEVKLSCL